MQIDRSEKKEIRDETCMFQAFSFAFSSIQLSRTRVGNKMTRLVIISERLFIREGRQEFIGVSTALYSASLNLNVASNFYV